MIGSRSTRSRTPTSSTSRTRSSGASGDRGGPPAGMSSDVVYDRAQSVRKSIHDVELTLFVAFALVVPPSSSSSCAMRSTPRPAVAIPVSIVGRSCSCGRWGSRSTRSPCSLVLAIGLVVDDAIVVPREHRAADGGGGDAPSMPRSMARARFALAGHRHDRVCSSPCVRARHLHGRRATGRLFLGVRRHGRRERAAQHGRGADTPTPDAPRRGSCASPKKHAESDGRLKRASDRSLQWVIGPAVEHGGDARLAALVGGVGVKLTPVEFFPIEDRNLHRADVSAGRARPSTGWTRMHEGGRGYADAALAPERRRP